MTYFLVGIIVGAMGLAAIQYLYKRYVTKTN